MKESDCYAPGSYNDPNAPWNEVEIPEREFKIGVEFQLSKKTTVESNDYYIEEDPDGSYIDTDNISWRDEYVSQHHTPLELIELFKKKMEEELETTTDRRKELELRELIEECNGWECDFADIYED